MNQNFNAMNTQTQTGFNNVSNATQTGFNNLNTTTLTGFNNAAFNNQASFNNTNTLLNQGINEINRDMSTATSQIIAGQNSLAAQMAHCCCDIKETIKCDGGLTRQLINDIRLAELNAALTDAKVEVSNLQQTNSLNSNNAAQTSTILAHITPLMQAILSSNNSRHGGDDRRS
jgi:hypothetical protein